MDFLKKAIASNLSGKSSSSNSDPNKPKSEPLDKAIDLVQEHILKQGAQKNESVAEQAKDAQIASGVKSLFKMAIGKDFPGSKK